ncbi:MAG: sulfotransferase family protein [Petrotogales bacterium]
MALQNLLRLIRKLYKLNHQYYIDFRERRAFIQRPKSFWVNFKEKVFEDHTPVFFLSTGRCGTKLVTNILNKIPSVRCFHKPIPELIYLHRRAYEEGLERFEAYNIAICAARFEQISECVVRGKTYVETNCRITFFAPHLYELFPKSRFVHLIRHPGDFVRSAVCRNYYEGNYLDIGRIRPLNGVAYDAWSEMSIIERSAWLWNETNLYIERFKKNCDSKRVITVKAEDIFSEPGAMISLIRHCGLKAPAKNRIAKWIRRPVNAQRTNKVVPRYKYWNDTMKNEVRKWIPIEQRYGYKL